MHIQKINKDKYIIRIFNNKNMDIYNIEKVEQFIKKILSSIIKKYNIKNDLELDIHINNNYGIIIEIKVKDYFNYNNCIDVKINFHLNDAILYKIDYFAIKDNISTTNIIYYYNNNYYVVLNSIINNKEYYHLLESEQIIYDENKYKIINEGIKISL